MKCVNHKDGDPLNSAIDNLSLDPFREREASITPILPIPPLAEATKVQREMDVLLSTANEVGPTLDRIHEKDSIPVNPLPFNEMASYFGAAGTILTRLSNNGRDRVNADELYMQITGAWNSNGKEFCDQVMSIILGYYAGHTDQRAWDAAVRARDELLREGFGGCSGEGERLKQRAITAAGDAETGMTAAEICRRLWFPHARCE